MTKICRCPKNQKGELTHKIERKVKSANVSTLSVEPVVQENILVDEYVGGSKFVTAFLGSAIALLMLATMLLAYSKFNDRNENGPIITNNHREEVKPDYITKNDADEMMVQVQSRIDELKHQMQIWNHREWLLALAVNENANISQSIDNRYHRHSPHHGYITFDRSWNINRIPKTMRLSEEEKRKILNGVE